jgi:hypothetical protein
MTDDTRSPLVLWSTAELTAAATSLPTAGSSRAGLSSFHASVSPMPARRIEHKVDQSYSGRAEPAGKVLS